MNKYNNKRENIYQPTELLFFMIVNPYIINLFCLFRNLLIIVSLTTLPNSNVNAVVENPSEANEIIIGVALQTFVKTW